VSGDQHIVKEAAQEAARQSGFGGWKIWGETTYRVHLTY